jgi:DNA-binding MarR family transcriptional regulator
VPIIDEDMTKTLHAESPVSEADLAERLRLGVTRLARRLRQQSGTGISPTQQAALATIERRGPLTLGELAAHERVQPPTITVAVGKLEEHSLVRRRRDTADRRVTHVEVTAAGRKLLARTRSQKTAYLDRLLRGLTEKERSTLIAAAPVLDRLLEQEQ